MFASRTGSETFWGRDVRPQGSELCVSDNGATKYIISDSRDVYDLVETPLGK